MDTMRLLREGPVVTLELDRPERRNALTQEMWEAIPTMLAGVGDDPEVRALLVRSSAPGIFCAGADISEYRAHAGDVGWGLASQGRVASALAAIRAVPVPSVAAIDGPCIGGGTAIALACDLRLCSDRSTFAITPARLGLVFPVEDMASLVALVGVSRAKLMLFTAGMFDAAWAGKHGLVDALHPPEGLAEATQVLLDQLCAVAPGSVRGMKQLVAAVQRGVHGPTAETERIVAEALEGPDHLEGVSAFLERRPPDFTRKPPPPAR